MNESNKFFSILTVIVYYSDLSGFECADRHAHIRRVDVKSDVVYLIGFQRYIIIGDGEGDGDGRGLSWLEGNGSHYTSCRALDIRLSGWACGWGIESCDCHMLVT